MPSLPGTSGPVDVEALVWPALLPLLIFLPLIIVLRLVIDRLESAAARGTRERRQGTLEERLERAGAGMQQSRELLDGVEIELAARKTTLARLTAEAEDWARLSALHQREAQAVSSLVRQEVDRAGRRSVAQGVVISALFFALGFVVQALT